jgi:hypothetical protein
LSGAAQAIEAICAGGDARRIGTVGGDALSIEAAGGAGPDAISLSLEELSSAHTEGLAEFFA